MVRNESSCIKELSSLFCNWSLPKIRQKLEQNLGNHLLLLSFGCLKTCVLHLNRPHESHYGKGKSFATALTGLWTPQLSRGPSALGLEAIGKQQHIWKRQHQSGGEEDGEGLLDERSRGGRDWRRQLACYMVNVRTAHTHACQPIHTILRHGHQNPWSTVLLPANGTAVMTFITSKSIFQGRLPSGFSPTSCTMTPKTEVPRHQMSEEASKSEQQPAQVALGPSGPFVCSNLH